MINHCTKENFVYRGAKSVLRLKIFALGLKPQAYLSWEAINSAPRESAQSFLAQISSC